jgi:hypothetical protein
MPAIIHKSDDPKPFSVSVRGEYFWMTPHTRRNNYFNNLEQLFGKTGHSAQADYTCILPFRNCCPSQLQNLLSRVTNPRAE